MDDSIQDEIAAAMGFSSFGTQKKNSDTSKPQHNQSSSPPQPARKRAKIDTDTMDPGATEFQPSVDDHDSSQYQNSIPSRSLSFTSQNQENNLTPGDGLPSRPPNPEHHHQQFNKPGPRRDPDAIAWTSPSGSQLTHRELGDLSNGRTTNEQGDMVFFKTSFLEDPWAKFKTATPVINNADTSNAMSETSKDTVRDTDNFQQEAKELGVGEASNTLK